MDSRLSKLVSEYQAVVHQAVDLLVASGIERPTSNASWAGLDIPQRGELNGRIRYYKHGYGCAVHFPNQAVDFDFGSNGEIDGFDASRLVGFADTRLSAYGFRSEAELKATFTEAVDRSELRFSGYLLYYLA